MTRQFYSMYTVPYSYSFNENDENEDFNCLSGRMDSLLDQNVRPSIENSQPFHQANGLDFQPTIRSNDEELPFSTFQQVSQNRPQGNANIILLGQKQNLLHEKENHQTTTQSKTNSNHYDNKRAECVTLEMNKILEIMKKVFGLTDIKRFKPNIGIQFRGSVESHNHFMKAKIYKILCYQKEDNKNVIINLLSDKRNELLGYIVNCSFQQIHEIYTNTQSSESLELDEKKKLIKNFLVSNDFYYEKCIDEKIEKIKGKNKKTGEEIINKKNYLIKYTKNLIIDIEGKGELKKRDNRNRTRKKEVIYDSINEIEKFA